VNAREISCADQKMRGIAGILEKTFDKTVKTEYNIMINDFEFSMQSFRRTYVGLVDLSYG
jgi:hypothetical protein